MNNLRVGIVLLSLNPQLTWEYRGHLLMERSCLSVKHEWNN